MSINKICLFGGGLIGSDWATCLLSRGYTNIDIYDISKDSLNKCKESILQNMTFLVEEGVIASSVFDKRINEIHYTTDVREAVNNADIIIENGPENLKIKQSILVQIEKFCQHDAVITTSSSGIMVNEIVKYAKRPQRIIGAHPYHPVYLLPLLEVVKNDRLEDKYLYLALEFFENVGKKAVVLQKDCPGYIASHLMTVLLRESLNMVTNGVCTMKDIDDAFTYGPGLRYSLMGIFTTLQLAGGSNGIEGLLCGPIGVSAEEWLQYYANWTKWPDTVKDYFKNGLQDDMNEILKSRDKKHGQTNDDIRLFRDRGLVRLLKYHGIY